MDSDSNKNEVRMPLTSNVLSIFWFIIMACHILKLFQPSQDASMAEPRPGPPHLGSQEILGISDVSTGDQSESAGKKKEGLDGEGYEVGHYELKGNFGVEDGKTDELFLSDSEGVGARDLSEQEDEEEEEKEEKEQEQKEAEPEPSRKRSKIPTADNNPTKPPPSKKQRIIGPPRKPPLRLLKFHTDRYRRYDATTQNQGAAVIGRFMNFGLFDDYAL